MLALIDDSSVIYKVKGCKILSSFLHNVPSVFLQRTGIGEVFHDALMPCLLYLPSLTEERDSLMLLKSAYPAMFALTESRRPESRDDQSQLRIYDSVLRGGILKGFAHAGEHVEIALLLFKQLKVMCNELGLAISKHLKVSIEIVFSLHGYLTDRLLQHLVPLISRTLREPLAALFTPLLYAAIRTLQALIKNAWPRMDAYRAEVWRCVIICWYRLDEEHDKGKNILEIQQCLLDTVEAIKINAKQLMSLEVECRALIEVDSGLSRLLEP